MTCRVLLVVVCLCLTGLPRVRAQGPTRIVFVAGPKDHGAPGAHEHAQDLAALKGCLEDSNVKDVHVDLVTGAVPDPVTLTDAAAIVLESSGDRYEQEHHALFPFDGATDHQGYDPPTTARLAQLDALTRKGMGVVVFHYATYVNNATARRYFQDWVGGYYESGYSRTVSTEWTVAKYTSSAAPAAGSASATRSRRAAPSSSRGSRVSRPSTSRASCSPTVRSTRCWPLCSNDFC